MKFCILYFLSALAVGIYPSVIADMSPSPWPFNLTDSDGNVITGVTLKGSAMNSWQEMSDGFTVLTNPKGDVVYAIKNEESGELEPTSIRVNSSVDLELLNITKHAKPEPKLNHDRQRHKEVISKTRKKKNSRQITSSSGTLNNLVLLIKFSNHQNRNLPSKNNLNDLFNSNSNIPGVTPSGSIRKVYEVSSYGALVVESVMTYIVTVSKSEAYYADGVSGLPGRISEAIWEALNYLDSRNMIDFSSFDRNNDDWIDGFTVLHSGYGAEHGGNDVYGTPEYNRIWSHKYSMSTWQSKDGTLISDYSISPMLFGTSGTSIGRIGVIAHELGHFLGLPDLYDYNDGNGIGSFGLMANSWGFGADQLYPPVMGVWSKEQLGWCIPSTIKNSGRYTVRRATQYKDCYKITHGFPSGEYLLIENRQPDSFDSKIPQGGLLILHIDESAYDNNNNGYPSQYGWPENGNHYMVAVLPADQAYHLEYGTNRGDGGDVYHGNGVNQLLPSKNVWTGPFPNTDSYKQGFLKNTGVAIREITASGTTMAFEVVIPGSSPLTEEPTKQPTKQPIKPPGPSPTQMPKPCQQSCIDNKKRWRKKCSSMAVSCSGCPTCSKMKYQCKRKCKPGFKKNRRARCNFYRCAACSGCKKYY